jgi:hypothetical protein
MDAKLLRRYAWLFAMIVLTEAVYLRPSILSGRMILAGSDYQQLHKARMAFGEEGLFGPRHTLPAWYPHELLGSPYAANLQSFPWIPTRFLLFLFAPESAYAPGVALAAMLAALFTYLLCRRAGLSEVAAAAAGWTFACAGFFASRVMAGHLPLLEAYPALPLLLWLADRALDPARRARHRWDMAWLAGTSMCAALAGHPQIPAYALAAALLYILWRGRGWLRIRLAAAVGLGSAMALAAWWPMLLLIQKSTRILDLDPPDNDIVFPYRRILALFKPDIDGMPLAFGRTLFHGYPNGSYFFDTASYIGLAPILAAVALLVVCIVRKRKPDGRFLFLAVLGTAAFLGALPLLDFLRHLTPGVFLRSPSRLLYLTTFSLAVALGAGVDAVLKSAPSLAKARVWSRLGVQRAAWAYAAVAIALLLHGFDLTGFSKLFVIPIPRTDTFGSQDQSLAKTVGDGRLATDFTIWSSRRRFDEVGTFDSLILAKPYRALLDLSQAPLRLNLQIVNSAALAQPALRAAGTVLVLTPHQRPDLLLLAKPTGINLYSVPNPAPRASFFGPQAVKFLPEDTIPTALRSHVYTPDLILLPERSRATVSPRDKSEATVVYHRPSSDEITLDVSAGGSGFVSVVESYDPGWSAAVDGRPVEVFAGNGFTLAAPVPAGQHAVRFLYETPGRTLGITLSLLAAAMLAGLLWLPLPAAKTVPSKPVQQSRSKRYKKC